jgi:hypothetical protein
MLNLVIKFVIFNRFNMIYQTLRLLVLAFVGLVMSACGGGGGGNTTTTLSTNCQTSPAGLFYEVTQQSGCTSIAQNNLISTVDLSTSYAVSDGGGSGGDGGGSGSGGDGGGAGAGDIWLRISQYFKSAAYALLGVTNAHAQAVTSCGVSQNDLYKLTSSGWVYQPLVKAGTAPGTACVKRIFDANKYLVVYANGLQKYGQTCYLVLVNKSTKETRCFSSNQTLSLIDDVERTYSTTYPDFMTPSLFDSPSLATSSNKQYFGAMFTTSSGRMIFVRYSGIDNASAQLVNHVIFDSDSLNGTATWIDPNDHKAFQQQLLLNNGKVAVHLYKFNSNGVFAGSSDSGFTYVSDENSVTANAPPRLVNSSVYVNPQCMLQDPGVGQDGGFVAVMGSVGLANYDVVKLSGNALALVQANTSACLQLNKAAVTVADGSLGRLYYFAPRSINGGPYNIVFSYVNLGSGALSDSVFSINRPASIQCGSPAVSADADLHEASLMLLEDQSKFVIAARTQASFSQTGAIASGGLSTVVMVDRSNPSNRQEVIPFSACTVVRKFEQASSGNYGLVTEPYGAGLSPSLVQTTSIRDQNFVSRHEQFGAAGEQKFKIGARLNPL